MFHACPSCKGNWSTQEAFLADPDVQYAGYQPNFTKTDLGFFLFNHRCGTTKAFFVAAFDNLYAGERYDQNLQGTIACAGDCLRRHETRVCTAHCKFAYARQILHRISHYPKAPALPGVPRFPDGFLPTAATG